MPKSLDIELSSGDRFPILYEDRSVLAIDKPPGWMLVPFSWQRTGLNLQAALISSIQNREYWARSRNLKFLRYIHRLDAETTGILLFGKSEGAVRTYGQMFETRKMSKVYLAVVRGRVEKAWVAREPIAPAPSQPGRMIVARNGKPAETEFLPLKALADRTLIEAHPYTGRTHQIRLHAAHRGYPILGDPLYGGRKVQRSEPMALRAVRLSYTDPFTRKAVDIRASAAQFLQQFGFEPGDYHETK